MANLQSSYIQQIEIERDAEHQRNTEIRHERLNGLYRALDESLVSGDVLDLVSAARDLCAMQAWKRGLTESEYLDMHPIHEFSLA